MAEGLVVRVNRKPIVVPSGTTVAVAVAMAESRCRRSVSGEPRSPLCGMGVCFECRVTVDGKPHRCSCQIVCRSGMEVSVDE
jgi:D-hydroxyproline dehydrogenase subunit gamma